MRTHELCRVHESTLTQAQSVLGTPPVSKRQRALADSKKVEAFLAGFVKTKAHTAKAFVDEFKATID